MPKLDNLDGASVGPRQVRHQLVSRPYRSLEGDADKSAMSDLVSRGIFAISVPSKLVTVTTTTRFAHADISRNISNAIRSAAAASTQNSFAPWRKPFA
jgi:hypothetical protein